MSDLERVGDGLAEVLRRLGIPDPAAAGDLTERWEEVAGEPWGERSRPGSLRDGVLTVEVDDGTTATLLRYRCGELVERLDGTLGPGVVTVVRIRVAPRRKGL